eukprot:SAG11_NODE_20075_length_453_cov_0.977401_1_plen_95_part_01
MWAPAMGQTHRPTANISLCPQAASGFAPLVPACDCGYDIDSGDGVCQACESAALAYCATHRRVEVRPPMGLTPAPLLATPDAATPVCISRPSYWR